MRRRPTSNEERLVREVTERHMATPENQQAAAESPILLHWLGKNENAQVQWALASGVSREEAGPEVGRAMIRELRRWRDDIDPEASIVLQALAGALAKSKVLPDDVAEDVCRLAADPSYGSARRNMADALIKVSNPRAREALIDMLGDPNLSPTAAIALGKRKDPAARPVLEELVSDSDASVRRQATRALRKLDGR